MMAGIVDSVNRNVFCGGTIISERYVLSAGHCMEGKESQQLGVLVGDHDLRTGTLSDINTILTKYINTSGSQQIERLE